jgi:tetratricopeptide (TPR) repeat protein
MLEQALATKLLQGNHLQIANTRYEIARLALLQQRLADAEGTLEQALATQRSTLPAGHPALGRSELLNVDLLIAMDKWDDARAALVALDDLDKGALKLRQGLLAAGDGRIEDADALLQQTWTTMEAIHGRTAPSTRTAAGALASLWQAQDADKARRWRLLAKAPTSTNAD